MDNYLKMLKTPECKWIQDAWKPKVGDHYIQEGCMNVYLVDLSGVVIGNGLKREAFWIPSLEDLFEIIKRDDSLEETILYLIDNVFYTNQYHGYVMREYFRKFQAWPELVLALIMMDEALKWDGERWVKDEKRIQS